LAFKVTSMSRRRFLGLAASSLVAPACGFALAATNPKSAGSRISAVAFDLFTLFDPRGIDRRVQSVLGQHDGLATTWKSRLFEYAWIRAVAGQYADFSQLVLDSLSYASQAHQIELTRAQMQKLAAGFWELEAWPDTEETLHELRREGLKLAPLANYAPQMIDDLLAHNGLGSAFDARISTHSAGTYKPDPRAYALAETTFALPRQAIAFAAFGGWDAAGARWFGYPTFWVNRLAQPMERLVTADASGPDLKALAAWLRERRGSIAG
jgi:2-haloacid dehalogenase